jgi:O-antigen/teichoic acid export membrane protein
VTSRIERLSSTRTLAAGILWNGLGRGLPIIVALLSTPFLLHHLGIDRWALFTLALSVAGSFGILDFGIGAALIERIGTPEESEAAPLIIAALVVLTLTGVAGATLGFLSAPAITDRFLNVPPDLRGEAITAFGLLAVAGPLIVFNAALWGVLSAYQSFRLATLANIPINVMY